MQVYFGANYFGAEYFNPDYFAEESAPGGLWATNYWASNYWQSNYWYLGATSSVDVEGQIAATLAGHSAALSGTFDPAAGVAGTIAATTSVSALFSGAAVQLEYFDGVDVGFSITWTATATDVFSGTVAATLADATSTFTGSFVEADGRTGTVAATLADATSTFTGSFVAAPSRTGTIAATLTSHTADFNGLAVDSDFLGTVAASVDTFTGSFTGTFEAPEITGTIASTLESFDPTIVGATYDAGVIIGPLAAQTATTANLYGIAIAPGESLPLPPQFNVIPDIISRVYRVISHDFSQYITNTDDGPFTWAIASGSLPAGLTLDNDTGIVSGTSSTLANYPGISFTVTNQYGSSTTATFTWAIAKNVPRDGPTSNPNKVTIVGI